MTSFLRNSSISNRPPCIAANSVVPNAQTPRGLPHSHCQPPRVPFPPAFLVSSYSACHYAHGLAFVSSLIFSFSPYILHFVANIRNPLPLSGLVSRSTHETLRAEGNLIASIHIRITKEATVQLQEPSNIAEKYAMKCN